MIATIKLYKAELDDNVWSHVTELPFSSDLYSTQYPVLNKYNTRLYFSSEMAGTLGTFDIFYVDIIKYSAGYVESGYSEPVNLGSSFNSIHREQCPFVDDESTIYFSSDGHQGLGGLDIFVSKFYDGFYTKPINLGETSHSEINGFVFILNEEDHTNFMSSNRTGYDDIFAFNRK